MRYLIHDFAGHPFQVQLSRELARRGHNVVHVYAAGLNGPKGRLSASVVDSDRLRILGIQLSHTFRKYSAFRRIIAHRQYARDLKAIIASERPDAILSGNTPIDIQSELLRYSQSGGIRFIHWVQDIYCHALEFYLRQTIGVLARLACFPLMRLERSVVLNSDRTVVIADAFYDALVRWGVPSNQIVVQENWFPLDELALQPRNNAWAEKYHLKGRTVFLYSGTLGLKHCPDLLYRLAESLNGSCIVVVVSEGIGRDYLERLPKLHNLLLLDFQPYDQLPQVLASADVLVATLETDAGRFAVPSKILAYLCAGRAILLAAPLMNLSSSIIERSGAGLVVDSNHPDAFISAAKVMASDAFFCERSGGNARRYAEKNFDIARIAAIFEETLTPDIAKNKALRYSANNAPGSSN
jgi:glycosyltransferase involved in cell wall biosynthesis